MANFIAVTPDVLFPNDLKQSALVFDQIAIVNFARFRAGPVNAAPEHQAWLDDLRFLGDRGFLIDPGDVANVTKLSHIQAVQAAQRNSPLRNSRKAQNALQRAVLMECRAIAEQVRTKGHGDAIAFSVCAASHMRDDVPPGKESAVSVTLRTLPTLTDSTPWEEVFEFRADPVARGRFLKLKSWINSVARADRPPGDLEDEIAELLFEYERHLQLHRIKTTASVLETVVTTAAGVADALVRLNFSEAAKALFSLRKREIALLEAEMTAPGRQVAYIVHAHQRLRG